VRNIDAGLQVTADEMKEFASSVGCIAFEVVAKKLPDASDQIMNIILELVREIKKLVCHHFPSS
jgi:hypothetical protein